MYPSRSLPSDYDLFLALYEIIETGRDSLKALKKNYVILNKSRMFLLIVNKFNCYYNNENDCIT